MANADAAFQVVVARSFRLMAPIRIYMLSIPDVIARGGMKVDLAGWTSPIQAITAYYIVLLGSSFVCVSIPIVGNF